MAFGATPIDRSQGDSQASQCTILGCFEDIVDARTALQEFQSSDYDPDDVSLMVRDRRADEGGPSKRHGAVAHFLEAMSLEPLGRWLVGLASVIVPEHGTFLTAGPLGAALTSSAQTNSNGASDRLLSVLNQFGFQDKEALYVEHRLIAGRPLVAVTLPDPGVCQAAEEILVRSNAVHVGRAQTDSQVAHEADALLDNPPPIEGREQVFVSDVAAPLRVLRSTDDPAAAAVDLSVCGALVVDGNGEESGTIEAVLVDGHDEASGEGGQGAIRYVVIGSGGVLGLGQHFFVVPVDQLTLDSDPVRITVSHDILRRGPVYNEDIPFSRREEQVVCAYFGTQPYWVASDGSMDSA